MILTVRPAVASDVPHLTAIARKAKASWSYPAEWLRAWASELTFTPATLAASRTFVAVCQGRVAGVCAVCVEGGVFVIDHLWVDPERQGHGIGRTLLAHARRVAEDLPVTRVRVVADPHAERFYMRFGARRVSVQPAPMPGAPDRVLPVLEWT